MKFTPTLGTVSKGGKFVLLLAVLFMNFGMAGTQVAYAATPSNDNFANAKLINSITFLDTNVDTTQATQQTINPPNGADPDNVACDDDDLYRGANTVWYKYTPSVSESISVDSQGSTYDTYIAVWTGTESNLTLVGCNDDTFSGQSSSLFFPASAGTTYYIEVAHFTGFVDTIPPIDPPQPGGGGTLQFHAYITNLDVFISAAKQKSYYLYSNDVLVDYYTAVLNGPVKVTSTINENIFTSQRVTSGDSYNELMGYPANQLTTEYWFPYYDHGYPNVAGSNMRTWILVGNADPLQTANVEIYIGGVLQTNPDVPVTIPPTTTFTIPPGGKVTPRWIGKQGGPVRVVSTNGVNIFASEREFTSTNNAFNENLGYPASQFTTEYWFPWYDNQYMATSILVGNTSSSQSAAVDIYIGANKKGSYTIPKNSTLSQAYAASAQPPAGPVRVVSTNGVNIVTSQKAVSGPKKSYNEVMGYPFNQFTTEYWFPWYDHGYPSVFGSNMRTWILVGNPSSSLTAHVQIFIDGVAQTVPVEFNPAPNPPTTTFTIAPRGNVTPRWIGLQGGPVHVVSDIPVFASERVYTTPNNVFNEAMGYPNNQLTTEYWYAWYDSVNMSNQLLVSKP